MSVTLTDVLQEIGSDKITFQFLNADLTAFKTNKNETNLSFNTDKENTPMIVKGTVSLPKVGLVLWLDKEDYDTAVKVVSARSQSEDIE